MKPEPSELVLRGCRSPLLSPPLELPPGPPRRFLKKSSKNSSNGEPGGSCGIAPLPSAPPLASTVCEVEMLTTASITFSATSAMAQGWNRTGHVRSLSSKNGSEFRNPQCARTVLWRKHLSRTRGAKTGFYCRGSWPCEYGEKPAPALTMTLILQHFSRTPGHGHSSLMVHKHQTRK